MSSNYYPFILKTVFCCRLFLPEKQWKYGTVAIFMTLAVLEAITLPRLTNATMVAQTPLVQSQCTDVEINKHIQQLNKGESTDLKLLVACNSKAVPALIKALENQDENPRIIAIIALGEIGAEAAPAVPVLNRLLILNRLLKDKRENIRIVVVYALGEIIRKDREIIHKDGVRPLIQALKDKNEDVRSSAANALGEIGKDIVPSLTIALKDPDSNIRSGVADALGQIGTDVEARNPYLISALKDTALKDIDSKVRSAAANAIEKIENANARWNAAMLWIPTSEAGTTTALYLKRNPPIMCKIPLIKAVLRRKCPRV